MTNRISFKTGYPILLSQTPTVNRKECKYSPFSNVIPHLLALSEAERMRNPEQYLDRFPRVYPELIPAFAGMTIEGRE